MTDKLNLYSVTVNGHLQTELIVPPHQSESTVAVIKHRLPPNKLGGPLHYHTHEDEISVVLDGTMTLREGNSVTQRWWDSGAGSTKVCSVEDFPSSLARLPRETFEYQP